MGVSGCGKTTVGEMLAERTGGVFLDGDSLHPPENKAKMGKGTPLTDEDRWPWFDRIRAAVDEAEKEPVFVACSALKRAYRDYLRKGIPGVRVVYMKGSYDLIHSRIADRVHEYMPASLLESQFKTLEEPVPDEGVLEVGIGGEPGEIVERILERCGSILG